MCAGKNDSVMSLNERVQNVTRGAFKEEEKKGGTAEVGQEKSGVSW